jgi:hypothetical protein
VSGGLPHWREFLGIPTYVFEGELFWGQDLLQMLEWRLTQSSVPRKARRQRVECGIVHPANGGSMCMADWSLW